MAHASLPFLTETVKHAVETTKYYKSTFKDVSLPIKSITDFERLPILNKSELKTRSIDFFSSDVAPHFAQCTSGTTWKVGGELPLLRFQSEKERQAVLAILSDARTACGELSPLSIRLLSSVHGHGHLDGQQGCFGLPLERPYHFHTILSVLERQFDFVGFSQKVRAIAGPLNAIKLLTMLCLKHQVNPKRFSIDLISSQGWRLSERWHNIIQNYWGAAIDDNYGLSEVVGLCGRRCSHCNTYHFLPTCYFEFVDPSSYNVVDSGVVRLLATTLFPLVELQPLIRYDTDDIFLLKGACERTGNQKAIYLGRDHQIIWADNSNIPILSPYNYTAVLDKFPDINYLSDTRAELFGLSNPFGWPKYEFRSSKTNDKLYIEVHIELRWSAVEFPDAAVKLKDQMLSDLSNSSDVLKNLISKSKAIIIIYFYDPGTTDLITVV